MKPIDALNDLKRVIYELTNAVFLERYKDQFSTIEDLIDKGIPATIYTTSHGNGSVFSNCPKCGKGVKDMESYCWHCGQKLYWEKTYTLEEAYNAVTGRSCANYTLAEEDDE